MTGSYPLKRCSAYSVDPDDPIGPGERLRTLYRSMKHGVVHQDVQGRIITANKAAEEILGVSLDEMVGRTSENKEWDAVREDGTPFPGAEHPSMTALKTGREVLGVVLGINNPRRRDRVWIRIDAVPVFGADGTIPVEVFTVFEDITSQRAADRMLIESREVVRNILRTLPMGMLLYELDEEDRLILRDSNPAADRILNIKVSELLGRTLEEVFPGLDRTEVPVRYREVALNGKPWFADKLPYAHGDIKGIYEVHAFRTEHRKVAVLFNDVSEREAQLERILVNNEILDLSPAAITVHDQKGNFLYTNRRNLELHGYTEEEFLGLNLHQLDVPESEALIEERIAELRKGKELEFIVKHYRKDGSIFPLQILTKLTNWGGQQVILSIATDLTERIEAEELLRASEARYRQLVENASEVILVAQDGMVRFINQRGPELIGYSMEEVCSRPFLDFIHPEDRAMVAERYKKRLTGNPEDPKYTFRLLTKNGAVRWVEINAVLIEWEGRPATLNFLSDVTERMRAEEKLRQSEHFYRTLIETSPDPILIYDLKGTVLFANERAAASYGCGSVEEFLSNVKNIGDILVDEDRKRAFDNFARTLKVGRSEGNEYDAVMRDGSILRIEVNSAVHKDAEGRPSSFLSIVRDITPQKMAEEALRSSENRYRTLFDSANDAIMLLKGYVFIECNDRAVAMFGCGSKEEILGKAPYDISPETQPDGSSSRERAIEWLDSARTGKAQHFEWVHRKKDGSEFPVEVGLNSLKLGGEVLVQAIVRDISERKNAELVLRESEEKYRTLLENLSDAVVEVDEASNIVFASSQIKDIFGHEPKEVLGRSFLDFIHPDDLEKALKQIEEMLRKNGTLNFEIRTLHRDGSVRYVSTSAKRVRNKGGTQSLVGVVRDITERFRSLERIEQEKNRAEFYLDLLSHDIGNIHQGLLGWTALARSDVADPLIRETALGHIEELEKRAMKLVKNVLLLSRLKDLRADLKPVDLVPVIRRSIKEVMRLYGDREMDLDLTTSSDRALVSAEPLIEEVFFNLLHNAVKFQNEKVPVVEIGLTIPSGCVRIDIADHGTGIADEQKAKLFDRHMKGSDYSYSGIGLSLVKELVTRYNGTITVGDRVEGDPSQGARFIIVFPRLRQ